MIGITCHFGLHKTVSRHFKIRNLHRFHGTHVHTEPGGAGSPEKLSGFVETGSIQYCSINEVSCCINKNEQG